MKKADKKKKALLDRKRDEEDSMQFKDKADRLMNLAFPTKRGEVAKAKQGRYHLLKGGSREAEEFGQRYPKLVGLNAPDLATGERVRIIRREFGGNELDFGKAAGVGGHEAGHDLQEGHDESGLMESRVRPDREGEDSFEAALRLALESGGRELDEEHLRENPPSAFAAALKALGVPDPRDSLPSKAVNLDDMLENNPPADRYEWQGSAWEDTP